MSDQMQSVREKRIDILRRNDVKKASSFGSIVRGEMTEGRDVDISVEFEGKKSLLDLAHLKNELEDTIDRRVDILTYKSLHPHLIDRILAEQVPKKRDPEDSGRTKRIIADRYHQFCNGFIDKWKTLALSQITKIVLIPRSILDHMGGKFPGSITNQTLLNPWPLASPGETSFT
jgi:predicted nucleotidyltransferase